MNLGQVFDTLVYGKGTAKRNNYYFTLSVKRIGDKEINGVMYEEIERTYYVTYKGITVLVISEKGARYDFDREVIYRISSRGLHHNGISLLVNKTLDRITSYMIEPHSIYMEKYER